MTNICNDNILYYYIINSKKIIMATEIIAVVVALLVLFVFIMHIKRNKLNQTIKKDLLKTITVLIIAAFIPVSLNIISNNITEHSDYTNCIEEEEINAIEETDITPPVVVEKKKVKKQKVKEEIDETIEIVEGEEIENEEVVEDDNAIYFLNVGAGTESFIISDQGRFGLIDTSYDSKASFILKQLKKLGAKELDFIIITHSHLDHMGGYNKIMNKMKVKTLYIKDPGNVNSDYVPTYLEMINKADEKGTAICDVKEEICKSFSLGNIDITLYNTEFYTSKGIDGTDRSRVENANSIATLVTINNKKIYFSSDIGDYYDLTAETNTAKEIGDIDVYKVAHHGYVSYNNNLTALSYLKPEYNIITNNKELSINAIKRIKSTSPDYKKTYYTTNGTVTLHVNKDSTLEFKQ